MALVGERLCSNLHDPFCHSGTMLSQCGDSRPRNGAQLATPGTGSGGEPQEHTEVRIAFARRLDRHHDLRRLRQLDIAALNSRRPSVTDERVNGTDRRRRKLPVVAQDVLRGESTDTTRSCRASRRWTEGTNPKIRTTRTVWSGSIRCLTTSQLFSAMGGT
jgi:hypothetical protein